MNPVFNVLEVITRRLWMLALLALIVRLALAVALYFAFGRSEYVDDIRFHLDLAADPFYYFACRNPLLSQQPPLLGAVETSLLPFVKGFGAFLGPRLAYSLWDIAGSLILASALSGSRVDRVWLRLLLFFGPLNVYASVVSAQDETISWFFACICVALMLRGYLGWAFLASCAGVLMAKILFLPVALMLAPFLLRPRTLPHLVLGGGSLAATYAWGAQCGHVASSFVLPASHTVNIWQPLSIFLASDWVLCFRLSFVCMTLIAGIQLLICAWRSGARFPIGIPDPLTGSLIVLLAFIGFFYHVVPEYFLVLIPFLLLRMRKWGVATLPLVLVLGALVATPVVPDILRYFVRFDLGPDVLVVLHRIAASWVTLMSFGLSCWLVYRDRKISQRKAFDA